MIHFASRVGRVGVGVVDAVLVVAAGVVDAVLVVAAGVVGAARRARRLGHLVRGTRRWRAATFWGMMVFADEVNSEFLNRIR
jgi:hypothetical protein